MAGGRSIKPKERNTLVKALQAGVVPRVGLHHIQVGRAREVQQVVNDIQHIRDGGSAVRFIVGDYGSGKTFFLYLARSIALKQRLVTAHADLSPSRRLHATGGQARALYADLMANLATLATPEGGALGSIVDRFIDGARQEANGQGRPVGWVIRERLGAIQAMAGGRDFAIVLERYCAAYEQGDDRLKDAALFWLRGEYTKKTEAKAALGVGAIIDDGNIYDHLRLMSRFVALAGYDGLLVVLDEMVNLYKLVNAQARESNYQLILRIVNDVLQGNSENFGIFFGGTTDFMDHSRRGLSSDPALRRRLVDGAPPNSRFVNLAGPVLRLPSLTREEFHVLIENLRHVFAYGDPAKYLVPDEAIEAFMAHCERRIGDAYFRTPSSTIREFLNVLATLEQHPEASWRDLISEAPVEAEQVPDLPDIADDGTPIAAQRSRQGAPDDDLTSFRLS